MPEKRKLNELILAQTKSMDSIQQTIENLRQELSNKRVLLGLPEREVQT